MLVPISTCKTYLEILIRARLFNFRLVIVQALLCVNKETRKIYFVITEFEVRTESYGQSFFFPLITYRTDRENEVRKVFILSLRLIRSGGKESS